ncbi:M20 family metallopeptidase [Streptomyces violaceochromogenes]|uniref:M20 family metallopeptidase n=1 Tax=Streptomyces violaceochromogenes TaxID=67377 RepID=A0ABU6M6U5_9ACTN|nr:M20 family metallopeptidase [Streptomyces violaceochromogenes]MEC7057523.1 M20 family metallopeptidase [Streptomyces violaceochromogenes]GHC53963.1 glutamate carboxypeptidase [Streptomyces violaceochromogenes]
MITNATAPCVEAMLDDLRTLVETESPSRHLDALDASARAVAGIIDDRLGGRAVLVPSEAGPHVRWSGGGEPKLLILGHHDTVFPLGTLERRPFKVEDRRVTGPGVFDMLGGLVQAIHGLALLDDLSGVEILVTADEEVGSRASRALIEERALACGAVLVFEGAADGGALKTGRKGCGTFEITITGRASHAGLEPAAGVNALIEAAHQVLDIAALSRPEIGTTVTPTVASAGTQDNVIPACATVSVDVRVESLQEKERVEAAFAALAPHVEGAVISVRGGVSRPPMPEAASKQLMALARSLQPGIEGKAVGGGSDGNFTAALGVPTLDGLGAVGGGAHADHEYLLIDTMAERARLVAGLVNAIRTQQWS